jgi:hypothetical protein
MRWSWKDWSISHGAPNLAAGSPHELGFGVLDVMSEGIDSRGKNQMLIATSVHSVAYTPPPFALKPEPYEAVLLSEMPQPTLVAWPGALTSQFEVFSVPVNPEFVIEHPGPV